MPVDASRTWRTATVQCLAARPPSPPAPVSFHDCLLSFLPPFMPASFHACILPFLHWCGDASEAAVQAWAGLLVK